MDELLTTILEDRVTDDLCERTIYGRDLAEVPPIMKTVLCLNTKPDYVARPNTVEQVQQLVQYCSKNNLPLIPRGSGSSAFYNSVPVKGGMTVDLSSFNGIIELDEGRAQVRVGAGTRWSELDKKLRRKGFAVKTYPSSAPSASVGGWLNMEGYGIGSLTYGSLASQIIEVEAVFADGSTKTLTHDSNPSITNLSGSDGTLAIVTSVVLSIRAYPKQDSHFLLRFKETENLAQAIKQFAQLENGKPYNIQYFSSTYMEFQQMLGDNIPVGEILQVDYEDDEAAVAQGKEAVEKIAVEFSGEILANEYAQKMWEERCHHMRIKQLGPTLMAAEDWIPVKNLAQYRAAARKMGKSMKTKFYSYGTVVSTEKMTIFTGYRADARKQIGYIVSMAVTGRLHRLAGKYGGHPYSVGLWNTPYLPMIYPAEKLAKFKEIKKELDPQNLMNPGKHYKYPPLLRPWIFSLGTSFLSLLQLYFGPGERE